MDKILHVEVLQEPQSLATKVKLKELVHEYLQNLISLTPGTTIHCDAFEEHTGLKGHVTSIYLCDIDQERSLSPTDVEMVLHVYKLDIYGAEVDTMAGENGENDELPAANLWALPSADFQGLWESLIFDSNVKADTLHLVETTLLFSDLKVNAHILNWNRVVLLHGPPGTGKTSLCKALAQKLSIRYGDRYESAQLVEINSHSLFSKWFSESGKLVQKLFTKIRDIIENPQMLVCVLIDEVESLTHARKSALNGLEPSDSIRVVNAVLTQIDQIRKFPNVLILTTSNMNGAIDLAFVDRADIKQFVGLPSKNAIYQIYHSCLLELMRAKIILPAEQLFSLQTLKHCNFANFETTKYSNELLRIAELSKGLSGRTLRKVPFLAHALHISTGTVSLEDFLNAMKKTVQRQMADSDAFSDEMKAISIKDNGIPNDSLNGF